MSDEDIIKKRLLIDGDGTGDDRRLNVVLKHFLKWTNGKNDTPENNQLSYDRLLAQMAQSQFAAAKSDYISKMIEEELKNYGNFTEQIEGSIEMAKQQIENSKKELIVAKQIRKNKMEYDLLAKMIKEQPDRKETTQQIEALKKELNKLTEKKMKLERKFQKRRNDFTLLMYCTRELEAQLQQDSSSSSESEESDIEDEPMSRGAVHQHISNGGGVDVSTNGGGGGGVDGAMDLSDDDQLEASENKHKRRKRERDYSKGIDEEEEESKGHMSLEEDTVLELSLDKDENDVVKLV